MERIIKAFLFWFGIGYGNRKVQKRRQVNLLEPARFYPWREYPEFGTCDYAYETVGQNWRKVARLPHVGVERYTRHEDYLDHSIRCLRCKSLIYWRSYAFY